jgi:putative nucleotidyltransferase with HDIG domain
VGLLDAVKRWQLARQGLSSGRKRRVYSENPTIQRLEESWAVKTALYGGFAMAGAAFILRTTGKLDVAEVDPFKRAAFALVISVAALVVFYASAGFCSCKRSSRAILVLGGSLAHLLLCGLVVKLAHAENVAEVLGYLLVPYALMPMLLGVLLGRPMGLFSAIYVSLVGSLMVVPAEMLGFLVLSLTAGITAVMLTDRVRRRGELLRAGIYTGLVTVLVAIIWGRLDLQACFGAEAMIHIEIFGLGVTAALGTALFTALFISGLLPVFEGMFKLTTNISWLELSDLNHRLLRRMQIEAPGTFHHSLIVASLAEAAAERVGANALMCRVCAYFHDIGKLKKPEYFIENQHEGEENPHVGLTPTMSALVIIAHVKDGVDMAVKHKLNPRIINVIQEHHGDSLVYYFYRLAQEQKKLELEKVDRGLENPEDLPQIDEKNYRYPGPRPSTLESGIIALADCVESASRTLRKPTLAKIRGLIEELVRNKINAGQLDDCPMTLRELALVKDSFAATLRSMLHARIDYPKEDERPSSANNPKRSDSQRISPIEPESASRGLLPPREQVPREQPPPA